MASIPIKSDELFEKKTSLSLQWKIELYFNLKILIQYLVFLNTIYFLILIRETQSNLFNPESFWYSIFNTILNTKLKENIMSGIKINYIQKYQSYNPYWSFPTEVKSRQNLALKLLFSGKESLWIIFYFPFLWTIIFDSN